MPYYIAKDRPGCKSGWATVKEDGTVVNCHETKDLAIKQMVAISLADGIEPGGEWSGKDSE